MKIRGQRLHIFSGNHDNLSLVASSTDCSITLTSTPIAGSRRRGGRTSRAGKKSWGVGNSGFVNDEGTSISTLAYLVGQPLTVAVSILQKDFVEAGIPTGEDISLDKELTLVGQVIVSNIAQSGSRGGMAITSVEYVGVGELGVLRYNNGFSYIFPLDF